MRAGAAVAGSSVARSTTSSAVRPEPSCIRRYATCGLLNSATSSPCHPAWMPSQTRILAIADCTCPGGCRAPAALTARPVTLRPPRRSRDSAVAMLPCDLHAGVRRSRLSPCSPKRPTMSTTRHPASPGRPWSRIRASSVAKTHGSHGYALVADVCATPWRLLRDVAGNRRLPDVTTLHRLQRHGPHRHQTAHRR